MDKDEIIYIFGVKDKWLEVHGKTPNLISQAQFYIVPFPLYKRTKNIFLSAFYLHDECILFYLFFHKR